MSNGLQNCTLYQGDYILVKIKDAIYSPSTPANLLTTTGLVDSDMIWDMGTNKITFNKGGYQGQQVQCHWVNNLPVLPVLPPEEIDQKYRRQAPGLALMATINYDIMHRRLMHAGRDQVLKACKDAGIKLANAGALKNECDACLRSKSTDIVHKISNPVATRPLEFVRIDTWSHNIAGHMGYRHVVHFICMVSGFHWIKMIREKRDGLVAIKEWKKHVELQTGLKVKVLGLDGGIEFGFGSKDFQNDSIVAWGRQE
ncbi:hypothetical protein QBC45DRAFT_447206, partial [Copromyces sp. CBS 386.78]